MNETKKTETENVYVTELKSLLKDKFFMLLLGISVAIVILSTFYSFVRPKTNTGEVASGEKVVATAESKDQVEDVGSNLAMEEKDVLETSPSVGYENSTGIAGLETVANDTVDSQIPEKPASLFDTIKAKAKDLFGKGAETEDDKSMTDENVDTQTPGSEQMGTPVKQGQTYTVVEGDNLWTLAEKTYSSGYNFVDIASANNITNPDFIMVGQQIKMPTVQAKEPTVGTVTSTAAMTKAETSVSPTHSVIQGDSLWNIAMQEYNDPYMWTRIATLNPTITNPDYIVPGQVLKLK
ncbi:LysM peptidoglycan-binding domain-containing protein [Candidatus Woesebacteria bacterium]|nr:LysM peptidoglycan-binding domain-containing protein [Candidatus Woesebacteria bacterium]